MPAITAFTPKASPLRNRFQCALILGVVILSHVMSVNGPPRSAQAALLLTIILSLAFQAWSVVPSAVLFFFIGSSDLILPDSLAGLPTLPFLLPFLILTVLMLPLPSTRKSLLWLRVGALDRTTVFLLVLTGIASTAALLAWAFWTDNLGAGARMVSVFANYPLWLVLGVMVPAFGLINSMAEEAVYRGVLQESLARTIGSNGPVIVLQALSFAAAHYAAGFPNGAVGYGMVFVYGTMLGYLRIRSRGILAPYLAHVIADLCIGYFLVSRM